MKKIIKYVLVDIIQNRIVLIYTLFLLVTSFSVFSLEDNSSKGLLSMLNVSILIVPLVSLVFSTIYVYNSAEFLELLVSQPLPRKKIWLSLYTGLTAALMLAFLVGVGIPLFVYEPGLTAVLMTMSGLFLTAIFVAIALLASVKTRDKAKGIGIAILLWLYFSILFDGLVLFLLFQFADYPLEKWMVGISSLNPVDLTRVMVLLQLDISAMMGYTGAVFKDFFGTDLGRIITGLFLLAWAIIPLWISTRLFHKKDL
ncbi:MAG: ABC transporter permease [Chitinophagaceae bacterium BSSC1]|nr:MAG: ABC transporter permease [Chitinophagaceae bacterium BSSC1]